MANIELPKDAEGRDIPLDTKVLYDADGNQYEVSRFTYSVLRDCDNWEVVFVTGYDRYASETLLKPSDSWEKLKEDLSRASERRSVTSYCRYFNATNRCVNCPIHNDNGCGAHKDECAFGDILDRIRKLRGEDE